MNQHTTDLRGIRYLEHRGKWEARLSINKQTYSKTFKTLDEAVAWRKKQEESQNLECHLTCGQLFTPWIESLKNTENYSKLTPVKYTCGINTYYHNFFGDKKIKDIDDKILMNFVIFLNEKQHLSAKTIKDHVSALSSFFEYCCLRFYLTFNPAKSQQLRQMITRYLRSIRKNSTRIREKSRTTEEIHSLLKVAFEHSYEFGVATAFVFVTGIRLGEIAALTWTDFILDDAGNHYCLINKTLNPIDKTVSKHAKSGSDGYLPVPLSLRKHLEVLKMKSADSTDSVFPFIRRNQDGFSRVLGKLSKRINARRITAHLLRHSFVSYLGTHDVNLQTAQKAARHSKISMTEAYFNASYLGLDKVAKTMECFLSNVSMPNVSQLKNWDNPLGQSLQQANI